MSKFGTMHNFPVALQELLNLQITAIQRNGWNGKDLKVKLQQPDLLSKMTLPYLYIEYPDGKTCPWLASQTDLLSNDWILII